MSPEEITERLELLKTLRGAMTEEEIQAYLAKTYASDATTEAPSVSVEATVTCDPAPSDGPPDEEALKRIAENFYREHQGEPRKKKQKNRTRRLLIAVGVIVVLSILAAVAMQAALSNRVEPLGQDTTGFSSTE